MAQVQIPNWDHCIWQALINHLCKSRLDPIDCKSRSFFLSQQIWDLDRNSQIQIKENLALPLHCGLHSEAWAAEVLCCWSLHPSFAEKESLSLSGYLEEASQPSPHYPWLMQRSGPGDSSSLIWKWKEYYDPSSEGKVSLNSSFLFYLLSCIYVFVQFMIYSSRRVWFGEIQRPESNPMKDFTQKHWNTKFF